MRIITHFGAALSLLATIGSCALLQAAPAREMDLSGTAWQVVAIDGRRVEAQRVARMIFPDLSSAILSTVCGDFTAEMTMDADGSALTFGELAGNERPCPADMRAWQASVLDAISATESWRVEGQGVIELVGAHTVRMERVSD